MLLFFVVLSLGLTCSKASLKSNSSDLVEDVYYPSFEYADSFDWKLLKVFSSQYKNVLISPISLKIILALLYQGSSAATAREFQNVLQFFDKRSVNELYSQILANLQAQSSEYVLDLGTSIFLDSPITVNPNYENFARQYYYTTVKSTNFSNPDESSNYINKWIRELTHGKVTKLVNPADLQRTIMLVTNAVYFKGSWLQKFQKNNSFFGKFYYSNDYQDRNQMLTLTVPYIATRDEFYFKDSAELDAKILRMPYKGSSYSMFIVLPNSLGGLPSLVKLINLTKISRLLYVLEKRVVDVVIPKFKFTFSAKLAEPLQEFGLQQMFQNTASFTGITRGNNTLLRQLVVTEILQKSGIEVDEEGSVVYSATDFNIGNKFGENDDVFNATHPFLFFIQGPNGTVLFVGKVENPLEEDSIPLPPRSGENKEQEVNYGQHFSISSPVASLDPLDVRPVYQQGETGMSGATNLSPNLDPSDRQPLAADKDDITYRFNLFDMDLLSAFGDSTTNVFISPASIKTTLAMILEGARGNCADEIKDALRIPDINQKGVRNILMTLLNNLNERSSRSTFLENHNGIFASDKYEVLDSYRSLIEQFYRGVIKYVNFKNVGTTVDIINQWVSDATRGAIKEAISPQTVSSETKVIISNALYFKGKWKISFDPESTTTKCFHSPRGCVRVPMMHVSDNFNYNYISTLRVHAVEIPYEDKFSMLIMLPSEETSIRSVIRDLPHYKLVDILEKLKSTELILEIPKFEFEYSADLVEYLGPLKIREIFGAKANLTGIIKNGNVFINNIVHKTKIEVDEQGTVAAASTSAIIIPLMGSLSVVADKPFLFYIYHKESANIIFEGILQNPIEQSFSLNLNNNPTKTVNRQFTLRSRQFEIY